MGAVKKAARTARLIKFFVQKGLLTDGTAGALIGAKDQLVKATDVLANGGKEAVAELTAAVVRELPKVKMAKATPDPLLIDLFTQEESLENLVLPLSRDGRVVEVAITEESDFLFIIRRQIMKGLIFRFKTARVGELAKAIKKFYADNKVEQPAAPLPEKSVEDTQLTSDPSRDSLMAKRLLEDILINAIKSNHHEICFIYEQGYLSVKYISMKDEIQKVEVPARLSLLIVDELIRRSNFSVQDMNAVKEGVMMVDDKIEGYEYRFFVVFSAMPEQRAIHVFPS